ncbi:MAG: hypothetical protein GXY64_03675 [Bacteroidales bacterium]|nr:hypothetical protein [Bacteroidales bacterium]
MKSVFIVYDKAHHDNVMEVLDDCNARGYTFFEQVGGRGTLNGEPHLGSHAWPSMNSAIITMVDEAKAESLLNHLKQLDEDEPMLGLRAFVWNVENTI